MVRVLPRLAFAGILVLAASAAADSYGQQVRRYQPSRPTVSPYLNLFRNNTGPLPNYYSLVRPQLQQDSFNRQQMILNQQQTSAMGLLESVVQQGTTPTGKHSGFMTYGRQGFMTNGR
jgi:hypothetical protein